MNQLLELTKTKKKSKMEPVVVYPPPCTLNQHVITRGGRKFCIAGAGNVKVENDQVAAAKKTLINRGFPLTAIKKLSDEQIKAAATTQLPMNADKKFWVWSSGRSYGGPVRQRATKRRRRTTKTKAKGKKKAGEKTMKQLQSLAKRRGVKSKARTKRGIKSALTRAGVSYK